MDKRQVFKNPDQVWRHLRAQGYKVSRATCYNAAKDGKLLVEKDNSVLASSVERFVAIAGLKKPASDSVEAGIAADRKQAEEVRALQLQNRKRELEIGVLEKKYIPRTDADAALGDLAAVADGLARSVIRSNIGAYLQRAGLDTTRAAEIARWYADDLNAALEQVCRDGGTWIEPEGGPDAG